jgi:Fervidolysin N-terminal prodomain
MGRWAQGGTTIAVATLAAVAVASAHAGGPGGNSGNPGSSAPRQTILVRFAQPGFNNDDLVDQNGDQADGMTKTKTVIVKLPPNANIDDKIAEYLARPDVAFAEPNAVVSSSDDYTAGRHGRLGHDHRPDGHGSDSRGRHGSDGDDGHRPDDHRPDGGGNDGFDDDDGDEPTRPPRLPARPPTTRT